MVADWGGLVATAHAVLEGDWRGSYQHMLRRRKFVNDWTNRASQALTKAGMTEYAELLVHESSLDRTYLTTGGLRQDTRAALRNRLALFESVVDLETSKGPAPTKEAPWPDSPSGKVFVVHGHHEASREATARFLDRCGLEPIILHEQSNQGRTIIEKFEAHSDVGFAVVLLTPDDAAGETRRARQNVIFEMGFFAGKLGRRHVAALVADGVERPSDMDGVVYIRLDADGAWRMKLAKELRDAGLTVNMERAFA